MNAPYYNHSQTDRYLIYLPQRDGRFELTLVLLVYDLPVLYVNSRTFVY